MMMLAARTLLVIALLMSGEVVRGRAEEGTAAAAVAAAAAAGRKSTMLRSQKRRHAASLTSTSSPFSIVKGGAAQIVVRSECPDNCSGHGRCTTPIVRRGEEIPGSQGQGGGTQTSALSSEGKRPALKPRCECYNGWTGVSCNDELADLSMCAGPLKRCSEGQGECVPLSGGEGGYQCRCFHPYRGEACEQNMCPDHCNGRGKCHEDGCRCMEGWTGPACSKPLCARLNDCSGHGRCVVDEGAESYIVGGKCECEEPFSGPDCSSGGCPDDCSGHGVCGLGQQCECSVGWTGVSCAEKACGDGCLHGECVEDPNLGDGFADSRGLVCVCEAGWRGKSCDLKDCPEPCGAYGDCGSDGTCICDPGWSGTLCEVPLCTKNCSYPNGRCVLQYGKHVCACNSPFQAPFCEHKDCPADPKTGLVCSAHGICSDGTCVCEPGFFGNHCEERRCPMTPQFVLDSGAGSAQAKGGEDYSHGGSGIKSMSLFGTPQEPPLPTKRRVLVACSGHGMCTKHGGCDCHPGWQGDACDTIKCMYDCNHHGTCVPRLAQPGSKGGDELIDDFDAVGDSGDPTGRYRNSQIVRKHAMDAKSLDSFEVTMPGRCECNAEEGWEGPYCGQKTCPSKAPPAQCSGHGTCLTGACYCHEGYTGEACNVQICPDLGSGTPCNERGLCVNGACQCLKGYAGKACERPSCPGEEDGEGMPICSGHGKCQTSESKIQAEKAFEQAMIAFRVNTNASSGSTSWKQRQMMPESPSPAGSCLCEEGWKGMACHVMECPNLCSNNGECVASTGECKCHEGFIGSDCSILECQKGCSGHGKCIRVNLTHPSARNARNSEASYGHTDSVSDVDHVKYGTTCMCEPGWGGDNGDCGVQVMCVPSDAQSAHEAAESGLRSVKRSYEWRRQSLELLRKAAADEWQKKVEQGAFANVSLFGGLNSTQPEDKFADAPFDCGFSRGHGRCLGGTCYCANGWSGDSCEVKVCKNECSGHGVCSTDSHSKSPRCLCEVGWKGSSCQDIACPLGHGADGADGKQDATECSGRGLCYFHNLTVSGESVAECVCSEGFAGTACELKQCPGDCGDGSAEEDDGKPFVQRGTCDGKTGMCHCLPGWGGAECKKRECPGERMPCSGHGACNDKTAHCECESGWKGESCTVNECSGPEQGSWNSKKKQCECVRSQPTNTNTDQKKQEADTAPLYWGEFCEKLGCPGYVSGFAADGEMTFCSGHGLCNGAAAVHSTSTKSSLTGSVGSCSCSAGFTGVDCSVPFGLRPASEVVDELKDVAEERAHLEIEKEKTEALSDPTHTPGKGPSVSIIRMRIELQFRAEHLNISGDILPAIAKGVARFSGVHPGVILSTVQFSPAIKNDRPGGVIDIRGGVDNATVHAEMVKYLDYKDVLNVTDTTATTSNFAYHSECVADISISMRSGHFAESAFEALDTLSTETHDSLVVGKSRSDLCAAIVPNRGGVCLTDAMHILNGPEKKDRELSADELAEFILMKDSVANQNSTDIEKLHTELEAEEGISMDAAEEAAIAADHNSIAISSSGGKENDSNGHDM